MKRNKKKNVYVKKGEKGFCVFVPIEFTFYECDEKGNFISNANNERIPELDENGKIKKGLTFKLGNVFDVNQTNAKDIGAYKKLLYRNGETSIEKTVLNSLIDSIRNKYNLNIEYKNIGAAGGYYRKSDNLIVINDSDDRTTANKVSTLFHELGQNAAFLIMPHRFCYHTQISL